jgi:hypothetical protein
MNEEEGLEKELLWSKRRQKSWGVENMSGEKKEEEFWGKRGHLYSAGGPTSDCDYGASNWERRSGFQRRELRANEEIGSTIWFTEGTQERCTARRKICDSRTNQKIGLTDNKNVPKNKNITDNYR